jgi:hypothetical protein
MAKVYTGRDGVMQLAGTTLVKVVNFQVSSNLETLETTTLNEHIRSYCAGVTGYSGSASLLYYKDDDDNINTSDLLTAYITSATIGAATGDIVRAEIAFQGTGALATASIGT